MSIHFGDKNVKEIRYGEKKVKEVWYGDKKVWPSAPSINLDPNSDQPIGRMDDGELWFRVWVKDPNEPFKIPTYGRGSNHDWDISIDGATPVRYQGPASTTPISIPMPVGKHYVKITPHNGVTAGWARGMGSGGSTTNLWNNNVEKLEFGLEWLPGYAFMEREYSVGETFLGSVWKNALSLTSMPNGFNLPQQITYVGNWFLNQTWFGCTSLTTMPSGFNLPQNITRVGSFFLSNTWEKCSSLISMSSGFNLPQGIVNIGEFFLTSTWGFCSSLISMPSGFKIPQGITFAGRGFLTYTWNRCSSLTSMPSGFNFPQNLSGINRQVLMMTWFNCSSLTSDAPAEPLNFPRNPSNQYDYAENCFGGTCPIVPDRPTGGSSVMIKRSP